MPAFDAYHKWLAIPPGEQPPNHYRLLGVSLFEPDPEVIEAAAERQTAFLRTLQIGAQAELASRILNEVANARITLLNVDRKMGYDAALKQQRTETEQHSHTAASHSRESAVVTPVQKGKQPDTTESVEPLVSDNFSLHDSAAHSIQITTDSISASTGKRHQHNSWKTIRSLTSIVLGGLAGICIAIGLLWAIWGADPFGIVKQPSIVQQDREDTPADSRPSAANQPSADNQPLAANQFPAVDQFPVDEPVPLSIPPEDNPVSRLPIPDNESRKQSQTFLNEVFQERYDETSKIQEPQRFDALKALAAEIYAHYPNEDDPATRFMLLKVAVRIATESGDPTLTTEIIDELSAQFEVDDLPLRATAVNLWAKQVVKHFRHQELQHKRLHLLRLIVPLAERAESEHRYGTAVELYTLASKHVNRERQADFKKRGLALQQKADIHDRMIRLAEEIKSSDNDNSKNHLTLGTYWCFELDDWEQGLVHLAASNSEVLSEIAQLDLDSQANLEDAEAVGDRWWDLKPTPRFSKHKNQLKSRAAYWYALAIGDKSGLARKKLEGRIEMAGFVLDEREVVPESVDPLPPVLKNGLVAYYPFNGNANDESGNGNDGTVNGATLGVDRHGVSGKSYEVSQEKGVELPSLQELAGSNPRTISLWVQHEGNNQGKVFAYGGDGPRQVFGISLHPDQYIFWAGYDDSTIDQIDSEWRVHTITYDGTNLQYYIDAQLELERDIALETQQGKIYLGDGLTWDTHSSYFNGSIDEVRIYNRALSAFEVKALYDFERTPLNKTTKHKTRLQRKKAAPPPFAIAPFGDKQAKAHQRAWADYLRTSVQTTNSIGMKLNLIPPGEFTMGSPASETGRDNDETQHSVKITQPFYLSAYEVTQAHYVQVMGGNPSRSKGAKKPIDTVSWNDAVEFCRTLSDQEGEKYRLPTEAEWEHACRAGTTTFYSFGDNVFQLPQYAWYKATSGNRTHAVAQKLPNPWGLYDMHGNIWEWCQDWYGPYGNGKVLIDPTGPAQGSRRVLRGATFDHRPMYIRSAGRYHNLPGYRDPQLGFRLARNYNLTP